MDASSSRVGDGQAVAARQMLASDVPAVLSLLKESPEASIWTDKSLLDSASMGVAWIAERQGRIAGFLIGRMAADEFEILNMAVAREFRRQGVATRLLAEAVEYSGTRGAPRIYLEVRASNEAARALYAQLGFQACGLRPNYYRQPAEDAVLMVLHKHPKDP